MPLVVYIDSHCIVCSKAANFIKKYDYQNQLTIKSLNQIRELDKTKQEIENTIVVKDNENYYVRFKAIKIILKQLSGVCKILYILSNLIPNKIGDFFYNVFALNRKKFGTTNLCLIPNTDD